MEAIFSSENSLDFQQTARRYILKIKRLINTALRTSNPRELYGFQGFQGDEKLDCSLLGFDTL
jgi:hypothetical protein